MPEESKSPEVRRLLSVLPTGRDNAKNYSTLLDELDMNMETLAKVAKAASDEGYPVIRYQGGLFLPGSREEWSVFLAYRRNALEKARQLYEKALNLAKESGCCNSVRQ